MNEWIGSMELAQVKNDLGSESKRTMIDLFFFPCVNETSPFS